MKAEILYRPENEKFKLREERQWGGVKNTMLFLKLENSRAIAEAKSAEGKERQTTEPAQVTTGASRICSKRLPQQDTTLRAVTSQSPMVTDSEWFGLNPEEQ